MTNERGSRKGAWKRFGQNRAAVLGAVLLFVVGCSALFYPQISRYGTRFTLSETHGCLRNQPPGARGVPRAHYRIVAGSRARHADYDVNGDSRVDATELSRALADLEFAHLDRSGDGALQVVEVARAPRSLHASSPAAWLAARDADGDGELSFDEARELTDIFPTLESSAWVRSRDRSGDGALSLDEFDGIPRPEVFIFGTDSLGRDLATRVVYGARISLIVGLLASLVALFIGVAWGGIAGWLGGRIDALMMRIVDVVYGLPYMFLVILMTVMFGRSIVLLFVAIGAVSWLTMARIVRGMVLSLKKQEYVTAARAAGLPTWRILAAHVLPNAAGPIIVYTTLTVPAVMLQEAFLSFLGLGVQAPMTSWGALASEGAAIGLMTHYPWLILYPGGAFALTLLALNFVGDGLRDALDPSGAGKA